MNQERLADLVDRWNDGEATPSERVELEFLLRSDPASRRTFVDAVTLAADLYDLPAQSADVETSGPQSQAFARRLASVSWAAVILAAFTGILLIVLLQSPKPGPHAVLSGEVRVAGRPVANVAEGDLLSVSGDQPVRFRVEEGSEIELAPSSEAIVRGPREGFRKIVELNRGAGKFRIEKGEGRFAVATPLGRVTVHGTEFSVELVKKGKLPSLAVAVTAGNVDVDVSGKRYSLSAGQKAAFGQDGQKDDGNQGQKDDGSQGQKDDGNQGQKDDGNQGQKNDGNQGQKDDGNQTDKKNGDK